VPPAAAASGCTPLDAADSERLAERLFERWAAAVASGDPEQVAALYAPEAVLIPTLSPRLRSSPGGIADYFQGFLARHPQASVTERHLFSGCDELVDTGLYSFRFAEGSADGARDRFGGAPAALPGGEPVADAVGELQARYTLVYGFSRGNGNGGAGGADSKSGGDWLVLHHHSSLLPASAPVVGVDAQGAETKG
jgi:hypothetical protein